MLNIQEISLSVCIVSDFYFVINSEEASDFWSLGGIGTVTLFISICHFLLVSKIFIMQLCGGKCRLVSEASRGGGEEGQSA
jgi:hypothetical protein